MTNGCESSSGFSTAGIVLGWVGVATIVIGLVLVIGITALGDQATSKFSTVGSRIGP